MGRVALIIIAIIILLPLTLLLALSVTPAIEIDPPVTALGTATPVSVRIADPHGVKRVAAFVEQNGNRSEVYNTTKPSRRILPPPRRFDED